MHIDRRTGRPFSVGTQEYDPTDRDMFTALRPQRRSIRLLTELFVSLQLALTPVMFLASGLNTRSTSRLSSIMTPIRASIAWPPRLQSISASIAACIQAGRLIPSSTR